MKRVLKFLLLTILIFALSNAKGGDVPAWINTLTYLSFFLSFVVLVGGFYYLIKVKKVKLFVFILCCLFVQPSFAQIDLSDIKAADIGGYRISDLGTDVCSAVKGGHLDLKALKKAKLSGITIIATMHANGISAARNKLEENKFSGIFSKQQIKTDFLQLIRGKHLRSRKGKGAGWNLTRDSSGSARSI